MIKKISLYLLSYISALLASLIGVALGAQLTKSIAAMALLCLLALLPIFLYVYNIVSTNRFTNTLRNYKVAEMNAFLVSHRDNAEETAKRKLKELQRIRRLTTAYTLLISASAVGIALLGGAMIWSETSLYTACLIASGIVFSAVFGRIRKKRPLTLTDDAIVLSPADYPLVYALARKAADTVGSKEEIVILLNWNCSASIVKDQNRSLLQIGSVLLNILSEQELYAILLHEFSHVCDAHRASYREAQYNRWLCEESGGNNKLSFFLSKLYLKLSTKYVFAYSIYQYASSVVTELEADRAMAECGDAKIAVSALLKTHYDTMYFWESCVKNEPSIFESEELKADYLTNRIKAFKEAIAERSAFWNELVGKEIIANSSTHPTLKMRMEALGISELALVERESSNEYTEEVEKILAFSEKVIYEQRLKTYEKDRAEQYLEPSARIEAWKSAGCPIHAEAYADLISDLKTLGRHEEAEALCDKAIAELPRLSSAHATFMKGAAMIYRYDEKGMDLLYRAMEQNGNYIEEGLDIIGSFCCFTGRESELLEYRKKAAQLAQKHVDQDSQLSFLSRNDNLSRENLPDGMLDEILTFIRSIDQDIIENIYLIRKTVSEDFFASVFIIHFYGGTDAMRDDIMHKIFRFLDSHPSDRQFSLFDYFDYPEIKVEKIEGSLVYSKQASKGDVSCQR